MTSTSIYTPFTYCITFLPTGKRYYGSRYANNKSVVAHPSQLWTTYFTSSIPIADLIEEHGKDSFTIEIRKTFKTRAETVSWEHKFLTKINAAQSSEWLNGHNGGRYISSINSNTPESIQKGLDTKKERGIEHPMKNPDTVQKCKDTKKDRGIENPMKNPDTVQKVKDTKTRNGTEHPMKNPDTVQKCKDTKKRNGTTNTTTPESIQKRKETMVKDGTYELGTKPFLSMLHNKKTYGRNNLSRYFPELKIFY